MTFETYRLDGVELARTGTWEARTGTFTMLPEHFRDAVEAQHDPEIGRPRIKFGHVSSLNDILAELGDGAPAYGYVEHLRVSPDGTTLLGDLAGIPESVATLIGRAYQQRSVEMRIDTTTPSGRQYKAVLTGLALLGATAPAVEGLADLLSIFAAQAKTSDPTTTGAQVTVTMSDDPAKSPLSTAYTDDVSKTPAQDSKPEGKPDTKEKPTMATWNADQLKAVGLDLKALGLDENATDEQITEAVKAKLTTKPEDKNGEDGKQTAPADKVEDKAPDAEAAKETVNASQGKAPETVTLSAGQWAEVQASLATLGTLAAKETERENEVLLSEALRTGKISSAERGLWADYIADAPEKAKAKLAKLEANKHVNMGELGTSHARPAVQAPEADDQALADLLPSIDKK